MPTWVVEHVRGVDDGTAKILEACAQLGGSAEALQRVTKVVQRIIQNAGSKARYEYSYYVDNEDKALTSAALRCFLAHPPSLPTVGSSALLAGISGDHLQQQPAAAGAQQTAELPSPAEAKQPAPPGAAHQRPRSRRRAHNAAAAGQQERPSKAPGPRLLAAAAAAASAAAVEDLAGTPMAFAAQAAGTPAAQLDPTQQGLVTCPGDFLIEPGAHKAAAAQHSSRVPGGGGSNSYSLRQQQGEPAAPQPDQRPVSFMELLTSDTDASDAAPPAANAAPQLGARPALQGVQAPAAAAGSAVPQPRLTAPFSLSSIASGSPPAGLGMPASGGGHTSGSMSEQWLGALQALLQAEGAAGVVIIPGATSGPADDRSPLSGSNPESMAAAAAADASAGIAAAGCSGTVGSLADALLPGGLAAGSSNGNGNSSSSAHEAEWDDFWTASVQGSAVGLQQGPLGVHMSEGAAAMMPQAAGSLSWQQQQLLMLQAQHQQLQLSQAQQQLQLQALAQQQDQAAPEAGAGSASAVGAQQPPLAGLQGFSAAGGWPLGTGGFGASWDGPSSSTISFGMSRQLGRGELGAPAAYAGGFAGASGSARSAAAATSSPMGSYAGAAAAEAAWPAVYPAQGNPAAGATLFGVAAGPVPGWPGPGDAVAPFGRVQHAAAFLPPPARVPHVPEASDMAAPYAAAAATALATAPAPAAWAVPELVGPIELSTMDTLMAPAGGGAAGAAAAAGGPALQDAGGPALQDAGGPALQDAAGPALQDASGPALQATAAPAAAQAQYEASLVFGSSAAAAASLTAGLSLAAAQHALAGPVAGGYGAAGEQPQQPAGLSPEAGSRAKAIPAKQQATRAANKQRQAADAAAQKQRAAALTQRQQAEREVRAVKFGGIIEGNRLAAAAAGAGVEAGSGGNRLAASAAGAGVKAGSGGNRAASAAGAGVKAGSGGGSAAGKPKKRRRQQQPPLRHRRKNWRKGVPKRAPLQ